LHFVFILARQNNELIIMTPKYHYEAHALRAKERNENESATL
jgi:hypothetical protein